MSTTQSLEENIVHDWNDRVTGARKKNPGKISSWVPSIMSLSLVWAIWTSVLDPAFKKSERASNTLERVEISDAQIRVLEEYERVMSELNLQIKELSEGEFSIEDEPPKVQWMYIPLNKPKTIND